MLSRASLLSLQKPLGALLSRTSASATSVTSASASTPAAGEQWPRPVRVDYAPVRHGFIPEEWFTIFYKKTGASGPYAFAGALTTFLLSKEIYVLEHEFYTGLSIAVMCVIFCKKIAPGIGASLSEEAKQIEDDWNSGRKAEIQANIDGIEDEKKDQWRTDGQLILLDAKKENVALQLEAAYRSRLANVYSEIKRRLEYQVQIQHVERRVKQKHLVNWVVGGVLKTITPDQDKENINKCLADLNALAARAN